MPENVMMERYIEDYFQNICEDSEECKISDKELRDYNDRNLDKDASWMVEWFASRSAYNHERQGFLGGFIYAMNLLGKRGVAI